MDVVAHGGEAVFQLACVICNWLGGACTGLGCLNQGPGLWDLALGVVAAGAPFIGGLFLPTLGLGFAAPGLADPPITTYVPGISPPPAVGEIIYTPDLGAVKVLDVVIVEPGGSTRVFPPRQGGGPVIYVVTEGGTLRSEPRTTVY